MRNILTKLLIAALVVLTSSSLYAQGEKVSVSGKVVDAANGEPLIGVTILTDSMQGVTTFVDGTYTIDAAQGTTLTFSYMGYKDVTWKVPTGVSEAIRNVEMESESEVLEDVVVIAYAVRKKGTVAGSVSTVKAEKVESTPTAAFDQALQGQVAGLSVLSNTGEPSAAATMTIRGTNSINSGTAPLYILDGVPISASDFNTINPADIESLSVLKDASSTSIYGARAANGVIVITTKRGRIAERPRIEYRMQLGISQADASKWDLMTTPERIDYEKQVGMTAGQNYNLLSQTNVNWMNEVFNSTAPLQNYEVSVSGADDKTNYYISGGYYNQQGTAIGSGFERFSMRANVQRKAADWLTLGTNTMLNYQKIQQADEGAYTLVTPISAARFMLPYWNPQGGWLNRIHRGRLVEGQWSEPSRMARKQPCALPEVQTTLDRILGGKTHQRALDSFTVWRGLLPHHRFWCIISQLCSQPGQRLGIALLDRLLQPHNYQYCKLHLRH